jgi:sugar lactone lactonase YvrE
MRLSAAALAVTVVVAGSAVLSAQRPSDPALLVPQQAPLLDYVSVPDPVRLPAGVEMGAPASVAFTSRGHLIVLTRGAQPLMEFDGDGTFVRAFGAGLFTRAHGLRVDADDNVWATDVADHLAHKFSPDGRLLLTIGTKGKTDVLSEPTDVAIARNGDVYITQGHTPGTGGNARVSRFDRSGMLIRTWGGKGTGPGQFNVPHGIAIDAKGLVWVTDREGQRIEIFDADGRYIREVNVAGLPCGLHIGADHIHMVNGFAGQIVRLDLNGTVLAATGKPGTGLGEFGEAHYVAVSPRGDLYVADTVNRALQKFVPRSRAASPSAP